MIIHHCLPLKPKHNFHLPMTLNNYSTHLTEAGLWHLWGHMHVPPGLGRSQWVCGISFCSSTYHSYYKVGKHKCYDQPSNQCFTHKPLHSNYTHNFTHYLHLPCPVDFFVICLHHFFCPPCTSSFSSSS